MTMHNQFIYRETNAKFLCVILAILCLWQLLGLIQLHGQGIVLATVPAAKVPQNEQFTTNLSQYHLFGIAPNTDIPETSLALTLTGIMTGPKPQAVIKSNGQDKVYRVGDPLPGGATVANILSNKILLKHNGRLESLTLSIPYPTFIH